MYILMRIGCIECGCESEVVGTFDAQADATAHAGRLNAASWANWMDGGQNEYKVFELPVYNNAITAKFMEPSDD